MAVSPESAPFSPPLRPLSVSSLNWLASLLTSSTKLSKAVNTLSFEVETETIADAEVVFTKDNVAPSITSVISFVLLEIDTPSIVKAALLAEAVSVFVLKKESLELPFPPPYVMVF